MRVFLRGVNEGLMIDDEWEVTVLEIQPDHVRLAIVSPRETPSYREETIFIEDPGIDSDLEVVESSIP
jgi:carbon storage regulator CsrA